MTLTEVSTGVSIQIQYTAEVNQLERHMCANGMQLEEKIEVYGMDNPTTFQLLHKFPSKEIPVTAGANTEIIERERSITVTRESLQEDDWSGKAEEDDIRCKVIISPVWLPSNTEAWSNMISLPG
jgi:hypothetical protein